MRVDLANWAFRTSQKFSSGVKHHSIRVFDQIIDPEILIKLRPHIYIYIINVLPKGRFFTANSRTRAANLPKGSSSIANSGTYVAVLLGMNRCGSFPLLSAPYSLFSIWTNLKRSEKIPGAPTRTWGERIWLTGPSGLHRNSPQGLNISFSRLFDQVRDPEIPITFCPQLEHRTKKC